MILAALAAAAAITGAPPPRDALDCDAVEHELYLYIQRAPLGTQAPVISCQNGKIVRLPPALVAAMDASAKQAERTPNLYKVPDRCKDAPVKVVDRYGRPLPVKLGDLPRAGLIYAVDRREDGCPVLVVAYGAPQLDDPNPPPRTRVDGVSKPEDAPSNRR